MNFKIETYTVTPEVHIGGCDTADLWIFNEAYMVESLLSAHEEYGVTEESFSCDWTGVVYGYIFDTLNSMLPFGWTLHQNGVMSIMTDDDNIVNDHVVQAIFDGAFYTASLNNNLVKNCCKIVKAIAEREGAK